MSPRPEDLVMRRHQNLPGEGGRALHDVARDRVQVQLEQADGLDAKIAAILGFGAALLGIAAAILALGDQEPPLGSYLLVAAGGVAYALAAYLGLRAFRLQDFDHGPLLEQMWANALDGLSEEKLYAWAAETYTEAYYGNEKCINPKLSAVNRGLLLLLAEFAFLVAAVLVLAAAGDDRANSSPEAPASATYQVAPGENPWGDYLAL